VRVLKKAARYANVGFEPDTLELVLNRQGSGHGTDWIILVLSRHAKHGDERATLKGNDISAR